jgi:amino acid adenylation domain-containing protein
VEGVETFYPLTPLQQGLLFETLLHPSSGAYFNQMIATLGASTDQVAFQKAWRVAVARHAVLRTSFLWEGIKEPVQVVERAVELPWHTDDWSHLSDAERDTRLGGFLHQERERGFDLASAPLQRFALLRISGQRIIFVWSFHHLLLDGWSMYIVLRDVFAAYEAIVREEEPGLGESPRFRDYVAWTRRADLEGAKQYWMRRLAGASAAPLVIGRPEAKGAGDRVEDSSWVSRSLSPEATEALKSMCRSRHITINTAVMGAWALLLSRYSGRPDVVFGSTVSGRPAELPGAADMVGLLINTLPVRIEVPGDMPAIDWLARIQTDQVEQRQYEYSPLFEIQGWCGLPRDEPLFDTVYLFENYRKDGSLEELGRSLGIGDVQWYERTNFPLAVLAVPEARLSLKAIYHRQRFAEGSVDRLLAHWVGLIEAITRDPDAPLRDIPLLSAEERSLVLIDWNRTSAAVALDAPVHRLVAERARSAPDRTALEDGNDTLTYAELEERASRVARGLADLGVAKGDFVAVCLERSASLIVSVLGVLKAGAAYVPLDPASPPSRLAFTLEDCGARVLLSQRSLEGVLPRSATQQILFVEDLAGGGAGVEAVAAEVAASDLAYMIYTSGSTGQPKGTPVTHASLLNLVHWHVRAFGVSLEDRATQVAGPGFDAFVWEIWPYLTSGASVSVVPMEVVADPEALRDWLLARGITIGFLPTPLAERVLALDWPRKAALRLLLTGGDRLRRPPRPGLPFALVNNYGPTESTVVTTSCVVEPSTDEEVVPPIGRPIANTRVYLLDGDLQPVPIGVPGELHIGGAGLSRGYHNRPDLTSAKFIPDPFDDTPGARLYKTGDLAAYRADGTIDFLGRIDFQVKIRGFRVELGEIEATLCRHPRVAEAVVTARPEGSLVAHVVARGERQEAEIRAWLRAHLPDYMAPSQYVWLDALPLTPNGKVDLRALPPPADDRPELEEEYAAPGSPTERALAEIWRDVLGLARVGRNDNFFDLGGHSLTITEVFGKVRRSISQDVKLVDLFSYPTVATLAAFIGGGGAQGGAAQSGSDRAATRRAAMQRRRTPRPDSLGTTDGPSES